MDCVVNELCYKGTVLQNNCRKIAISQSFSYSFVKFQGAVARMLFYVMIVFICLCINFLVFEFNCPHIFHFFEYTEINQSDSLV